MYLFKTEKDIISRIHKEINQFFENKQHLLFELDAIYLEKAEVIALAKQLNKSEQKMNAELDTGVILFDGIGVFRL